MTTGIIKPQILRGFRDYLPEAMLPREQLMETARRVYRSFGFSPIDTPALEYSEILLGKGGAESDKQLFRFNDQGGRDVAMRFDLTVPLARFTAQHLAELGTPFKRYHIAPVWRAERPQRGRFREFYQCDFDTIGTTSNAADVETALVIYELFCALGFERFSIRVNHRGVLNGYLEKLGLVEKATPALRILDKLHKIGTEAVAEEMTRDRVATAEQAQSILKFAAVRGDNSSVLEQLEKLVEGSEAGARGIDCLRELIDGARSVGIAEERVRIDPSIARGLDYYTGTIYETFLDDLPSIGSVCSGGRYDDLAGLYTKQQLPGVGASLGLDRLLDAMDELGMLAATGTPAPVLVVFFVRERLGDYLRLAHRLRAEGIGTELYPEPKPIGRQLKYADRRGFRVAVIAGDDELARGVWQVKDLQVGKGIDVADAEVIPHVRSIVAL